MDNIINYYGHGQSIRLSHLNSEISSSSSASSCSELNGSSPSSGEEGRSSGVGEDIVQKYPRPGYLDLLANVMDRLTSFTAVVRPLIPISLDLSPRGGVQAYGEPLDRRNVQDLHFTTVTYIVQYILYT